MKPLGFGRSVAFLCGGLLVWAALFVWTYTFAAAACARGGFHALWFGVAVVPALLLVTIAAALGVLHLIARRADRLQDGVARRNEDTRRVVAHVAMRVCGLALIAIVWTALPLVLTAQPC